MIHKLTKTIRDQEPHSQSTAVIVSSVLVADAFDLTLNPNTADVNSILREENKKATYVIEKQSYPDNPERFDCRQVVKRA